jgi:hypothetical protein
MAIIIFIYFSCMWCFLVDGPRLSVYAVTSVYVPFSCSCRAELYASNCRTSSVRIRVTVRLEVYSHQFVLAPSPLSLMSRNFFFFWQLNPLITGPYVTFSPTTGDASTLWPGFSRRYGHSVSLGVMYPSGPKTTFLLLLDRCRFPGAGRLL